MFDDWALALLTLVFYIMYNEENDFLDFKEEHFFYVN
ncbi:hypothetical protein EDD69_11735 [Thermolongibacillus altinsuensis]|jgi:hypothetical protein|uniref:Uncharacterized protein n=1 Tax=Thermolongibacillus altinsuensis TaxID=575256 RepID=A0A4R1QEQ9_9BACL|nr:hypothetical protein EDD69_11735 [Thermolongibacillus altinsuensis]